MLKLNFVAAFAAGFIALGGTASAVTIGFEGTNATPYLEGGFTIDDARIVGGQCAAGSCMGLNKNEVSILTRVGGGTFTLDSFWWQRDGTPSQLTVKAYNGASLIATYVLGAAFAKNTPHTFSTVIADITSLVFDNTGNGNVRVDGIGLTLPPVVNPPTPGNPVGDVPIPGAVWLMGSVIAAGAGFGAARRRRQKRAA